MSKTNLVRVFNKGTHTFQYGSGSLKPGTFADVTEAEAKLLCDFTQGGEHEVVLGSDLPSTTAPLDADALKKIADLQNEKSAFATQNSELIETVKGQQTQIENLEKLLKKAMAGHKK